MPAPILATVPDDIRAGADLIYVNDTWTGDQSCADPFGPALDATAAIWQGIHDRLPYLFSVPNVEAAEQVKRMVRADARVWAAVTFLAERVDTNAQGPVDDPVDHLAGWLRWPGMTRDEVFERMQAVAYEADGLLSAQLNLPNAA